MIWALDERDRSELSSPHASQMMQFGDLATVGILESVAENGDPTKHFIHDDILGPRGDDAFSSKQVGE